jgi:hypothetical protein
VQETAASELQGSDESQRKAVSFAFDYLDWVWASGRMEFMIWYAMHDMNPADCHRIAGIFGDLPEADRALFAMFLCSFGLRDNEGNARPAWDEWVSRAQQDRGPFRNHHDGRGSHGHGRSGRTRGGFWSCGGLRRIGCREVPLSANPRRPIGGGTGRRTGLSRTRMRQNS